MLATDWYYDNSKGDSTWSASLGSEGVDGNWYYMDGADKKYMQGSYSETDNFNVLDVNNSLAITVDQAVTMNNFTISAYGADYSGYGLKLTGTDNSLKFTVNGTFTSTNMNADKTGNANLSAVLKNLDFYFANGVQLGTGYDGIYGARSVYINGDLDAHMSQIGANGLTAERIAAGTDSLAAGIANPDFIVTGVIKNASQFQIEAKTYAYY